MEITGGLYMKIKIIILKITKHYYKMQYIKAITKTLKKSNNLNSLEYIQKFSNGFIEKWG